MGQTVQWNMVILVVSGAKTGPTGQSYRKCRNKKCSAVCSNKRQIEVACTKCATNSGCQMPKLLGKMTKCAQTECAKQCSDGLRSKSCKECRKSGVCFQGARRNSKAAEPLALLRKFIIGGNGKRIKIGNGTKGQLRCAMGMCSNQCLLKHTGKLSAECQKCVEKFCPLINATSSSCIAAENNKEPSYNFCTNIMDCNKGGVGPVAAHVTGLACTKNTACCTWDI